jgi:O-antigen ligase
VRTANVDPSRDASLNHTKPSLTAAGIASVVIVSWLPVVIGANTRTAVGWIAAAVLAVAAEALTVRLAPVVLVTGLVLSSAFVASGLVTDPTHYMPVAVSGGALALRFALDTWRSRSLHIVSAQPVLIAVGVYLVWAALATATSIDHRVSLEYLVGMVAVCALAFVAIPAMLEQHEEREYLLAGVGVLGVLVAVSVYVIAITGSISVFGHTWGDVQKVDMTLAGHATGLIFLRSSGVYLAPLEAGIVMVMAAGALIGWSAARPERRDLPSRLAIVFMTPAILLTLDRTSWLAVIVSSAAFAYFAATRKMPALTAAVTFAFFAATFGLVQLNAIGVNAVRADCYGHCRPSGTFETPLRGATGLSGRDDLWRASLQAIEHRPILGYGPGNNVPAIAPYLGATRALTQDLTSHSTWFRTAVEFGVPGFLMLVAVMAVVAWVFYRRWRAGMVDPPDLALAGTVVGLAAAMTFETFLLGGVTFSSLYFAVALGGIAWLRPYGGAARSGRPARV